MVVHGCQQSSELLALSGQPEGGCILFRIEPTATIQCHTNSWALFRTRVSHISYKRISQATGSVECRPSWLQRS
jgi:hypothetical protein